ncbi:hypothetical protein MTO96_022021 [Rhipicephalus appendiculatus]
MPCWSRCSRALFPGMRSRCCLFRLSIRWSSVFTIYDLGAACSLTVPAQATNRQSSKGKALQPLESGTSVRIHNGDWSRTATGIEQAAPRSYMVKTEDQRILRRNRQHLLRIPGNSAREYRDQQDMVDPSNRTQSADHEGANHSGV